MKVEKHQILIAVLSTAVVLYLVAGAVGHRTSPGELAVVHARIPELAGNRGCAECHGGWTKSMTGACLECHGMIEAQMQAGTGLHGALDEDARSCALCHSDHHGSGFSIVNRRSFALAGVADPDAFDHQLVGFAMAGRHLELDCTECHEYANEPILPEGSYRYLGLEPSCATCHEDPHRGEMSLSCTSCHDQVAFDPPIVPDHDRYLPLDGGHAGLSCRTCHEEGSPHALESIGQLGRRIQPRTCLDCHASPHTESFLHSVTRVVTKKAVTEDTPDAAASVARAATTARTPGSCDTCHRAEHTSFRDERIEMTPELHACSGFLLDAPHAGLACLDCHPDYTDEFERRYPGRGATECRRCHEDPHKGEFDRGPFAGQECTACHDHASFEPHAFGIEEHALTAMALTGSHASTDCDGCHGEAVEGGPRAFRGTPTDCEACHADAHLGFFEVLGIDAPSPHHDTPPRGPLGDLLASFDGDAPVGRVRGRGYCVRTRPADG